MLFKDIPGFPETILENFQKLLQPITNVESSEEEGEYVEYVYNPRKYFLVSICHVRFYKNHSAKYNISFLLALQKNNVFC